MVASSCAGQCRPLHINSTCFFVTLSLMSVQHNKTGSAVLWAGVRAIGKLTLCDLAGSERITKTGATGAPNHPTQSSHPTCPVIWLESAVHNDVAS